MRRESDAGKETSAVEDCKEKSERKRQREKQRRSELTNAFDDLSTLVLKMDTDQDEPALGNEDGSRKKNRRMSGRSDHEGESSGGMTRVDLINRALAIMKRLHHENSELKAALARNRGDKNEVMVMVPTLTPADDATAPPPAASVSSFRPPPPYMPHGFPPPEHAHPSYPPSRYPPPPPPGGWGPSPPFPPPPYGDHERPPPPPHR